tara:strand:- start:27332 stop:27937 length:606 start_codon:yes stop_codon:yes gene_type:complete
MINILLSELKQIAQSILDQEDSVNLAELELQLRVLQKQITILEHEQQRSLTENQSKVEPIEFENSKQIIQEPAPSELAPQEDVTSSLESLFANSISDPVFVKKENPISTTSDSVQEISKNLNDILGKGLKVGLNDRLAFIKNLFNGSVEEYQRVVSQIQTYDDPEEAQNFIENLVKPDYNHWEGKESFELRFIKIIEQNFN